MAIGKVKALISRLLKLDSDYDMRLYYISKKVKARMLFLVHQTK